mgnify:FL=1
MSILTGPVIIVYLMGIANKSVFTEDSVNDVRFKGILDMIVALDFICDAKDAAKEVTNKKSAQ